MVFYHKCTNCSLVFDSMYVDECSARNSHPDLYMDLFPGHPGEKKYQLKNTRSHTRTLGISTEHIDERAAVVAEKNLS